MKALNPESNSLRIPAALQVIRRQMIGSVLPRNGPLAKATQRHQTTKGTETGKVIYYDDIPEDRKKDIPTACRCY
jgi:hypothetical protein